MTEEYESYRRAVDAEMVAEARRADANRALIAARRDRREAFAAWRRAADASMAAYLDAIAPGSGGHGGECCYDAPALPCNGYIADGHLCPCVCHDDTGSGDSDGR